MRAGRSADCRHRPVVTDALWRQSATALTRMYRSGETTPSIALEAVLGRYDEINDRLNAVVILNREEAWRAASASSERWAKGKPLGALDGVPVSVKDNLLVGEMRATWGSRKFENFVPGHDELPVARLRQAGALLFGKTNVPEFTVQGITDNALFGPTRNPWNLETTPGGSSGGGAAAVAAGIGPLALCTDGGGSIRRPAAHCGLFGFKPSSGLVPRGAGFPPILNDFEVVGPLARTVADARAMIAALAGRDLGRVRDDQKLRILCVQTFGDAPVASEIRASLRAAAETLQGLGNAIAFADRFDLADRVSEIWPIISCTGVNWLLRRHASLPGVVGEAVRQIGEAGSRYTASDYLQALIEIDQMKSRFARLFETTDLILTPTIAALAWPIGETHPTEIDGRSVGPRGHAVFTAVANALGLPAINLPSQPAQDGSRIGVQLLGPSGSDGLLLAVAAQYEDELAALEWPSLSDPLMPL
jgi:aspartyl-tRNA(Asn)/glutamyl-tRNA(Gln) amidotransferase subunit A